MSLLDTASLIVTPNGYKEGKLYSVIPSDGSGDMSVTRATTATRVNSAGLVELVPYNLFSYSQNLADASWATYAASGTITRTANYGVAPDGTTTATRIQNSGGDPIQWTYQNISLPSNGIISMYVKRTGASNQTFRFFSNNGATFSSNFTATDTWQRFEFAVGSNTGALPFGITTDSSGTAADILVWGAQIVEGSVAKDYQKTETRLNIPRLDYSNGTCPSLLVEPQRTNLVTYSSSFDNAVWGAPSNVVANSVISPSGIQDADTLTGGLYRLQVFSATSYVFSFYAKKNTSSTFAMRVDAPTNNTCNFNLDTGVADGGATMESVGNGWYRCYMPFTSGFSGTGVFYPNVNNDNLYIWGAQLEAGSYPTSYIPTTSASVTRNADVISKTGISSLIGQTEGAVMIDINIDSSFAKTDMRFIDVSDNSIANWYFIGTNNANEIRFYFRSSNTAYVSITTTLTNGRHKLAFAYANNDYVAYVDGVQVHSTTTLAVGSTSKVTLGNDFGGFNASKQFINASALWKTRLTNAQLATLTTI